MLGYSQGGAIAQQLALDDPTRCDRLVLVCTFAFNMATYRIRRCRSTTRTCFATVSLVPGSSSSLMPTTHRPRPISRHF
ncbi:MAG: alpha/beta fold hydrolase [Nocardioidaceae bacterium]